jgi:hypothetical protein
MAPSDKTFPTPFDSYAIARIKFRKIYKSPTIMISENRDEKAGIPIFQKCIPREKCIEINVSTFQKHKSRTFREKFSERLRNSIETAQF